MIARVGFLWVLMLLSMGSVKSQMLTKQELEFDLLELKEALLEYHPNLFLYNSPAVFNHYFDSVFNSIPDEVDEFETNRIVSSFSEIIQDGHTIILPSADRLTHHRENDVFFPFKIYWDGRRMYLLENWSDNSQLHQGDRISRLNGKSADFTWLL